ncbi:MAG: DUF4397 domain-containing protein [Planctomycetes bacterium]|nr:DUF4397 domain-containing protein [Planctomycetota bacterium]
MIRSLFVPVAALAAVCASESHAQQITLVFGNGLSPQPVQVDVNGSGVPRTVGFGATTSYTVPFPGAVVIDVTLQGSSLSTTLIPAVETEYSVLLHPDAGGAPLLRAYDENESPIPLGGGGRLVFRHLAALGQVDATVRGPTGQVVAQLLQNVNANDADVDIPAGAHTVEFTATGSTTPLLPPQPVTVGVGEHVVIALIGAAATGLSTLTESFQRPETVVLSGPGCGSALVRYYATVDLGGADLEFATGPLPTGALVYLLFGLQPQTIALAPYGAPGCEVGLNPNTIIPVGNVGGVASLQFHVPAAIASTIGPTWWQFGHTGASNVLGVETAATARLMLN